MRQRLRTSGFSGPCDSADDTPRQAEPKRGAHDDGRFPETLEIVSNASLGLPERPSRWFPSVSPSFWLETGSGLLVPAVCSSGTRLPRSWRSFLLSIPQLLAAAVFGLVLSRVRTWLDRGHERSPARAGCKAPSAARWLLLCGTSLLSIGIAEAGAAAWLGWIHRLPAMPARFLEQPARTMRFSSSSSADRVPSAFPTMVGCLSVRSSARARAGDSLASIPGRDPGRKRSNTGGDAPEARTAHTPARRPDRLFRAQRVSGVASHCRTGCSTTTMNDSARSGMAMAQVLGRLSACHATRPRKPRKAASRAHSRTIVRCSSNRRSVVRSAHRQTPSWSSPTSSVVSNRSSRIASGSAACRS